MSILLVAAANATTGGGERHTADLACALADRGVRLGIAAPAGGDLARIANTIGADYFPLPLDGALRPKTIRALRGVICQFAPDIVHAQGARAAAFARPADPQARRRLIYTVHGIHADQGGPVRFAKLALERVLRRRTAQFITVCAADKERGAHLRLLDPQRSRVIYNGIAVHTEEALKALASESAAFREEAGTAPDTPLLLHVGRICPQKNQPQLLEAFSAVLAEATLAPQALPAQPPARPLAPRAILALISAGSAQQRSELAACIERLGLTSSVRLLPPRPDLTAAFVAADLFVLPSLWEGFPYTIIEAADAGCAIVTTDVGGNKEAILPPQEGWLAPPDDLSALTEVLTEAIGNPEQRQQRAARAKAHVDAAFTLEAMVEQTVACYQDVIDSVQEEERAHV